MDSNKSTVRQLRPLIDGLDPEGALLERKYISELSKAMLLAAFCIIYGGRGLGENDVMG